MPVWDRLCSILNLIVVIVAICVAVGNKAKREHDKRSGKTGIHADRHYAAVGIILALFLFDLWFWWSAGFLASLQIVSGALLILWGWNCMRNDKRTPKDERKSRRKNGKLKRPEDSLLRQRNDFTLFSGVLLLTAGIGFLLLPMPRIHFGHFVVAYIAIAMAVLWYRYKHKENATSLAPSRLAGLSAIVTTWLFIALFLPGGMSAWWGWTLVVAIVVTTWAVISGERNIKNGWVRWVLSWALVIGMLILTAGSISTVVHAYMAADEGDDNSPKVEDIYECPPEHVLTEYTFEEASAEEVFDEIPAQELLGSDVEAFKFALETLREHPDYRVLLPSHLEHWSEETGVEIPFDINDLKVSDLKVDNCLSPPAQAAHDWMVDELSREQIEAIAEDWLASR